MLIYTPPRACARFKVSIKHEKKNETTRCVYYPYIVLADGAHEDVPNIKLTSHTYTSEKVSLSIVYTGHNNHTHTLTPSYLSLVIYLAAAQGVHNAHYKTN